MVKKSSAISKRYSNGTHSTAYKRECFTRFFLNGSNSFGYYYPSNILFIIVGLIINYLLLCSSLIFFVCSWRRVSILDVILIYSLYIFAAGFTWWKIFILRNILIVKAILSNSQGQTPKSFVWDHIYKGMHIVRITNRQYKL